MALFEQIPESHCFYGYDDGNDCDLAIEWTTVDLAGNAENVDTDEEVAVVMTTDLFSVADRDFLGGSAILVALSVILNTKLRHPILMKLPWCNSAVPSQPALLPSMRAKLLPWQPQGRNVLIGAALMRVGASGSFVGMGLSNLLLSAFWSLSLKRTFLLSMILRTWINQPENSDIIYIKKTWDYPNIKLENHSYSRYKNN